MLADLDAAPGPDRCEDCLEKAEQVKDRLDEAEPVFHQTVFLSDTLCRDTTCRSFLTTDWESISSCLTQQWILTNLTCIVYGQCQQSHTYWTCPEVGTYRSCSRHSNIDTKT